jgi:hypothetical protein
MCKLQQQQQKQAKTKANTRHFQFLVFCSCIYIKKLGVEVGWDGVIS